MKPIVLHLVAAARPNFMKIAPLYHALKSEAWVRAVIVYTGQHYDANMSNTFLHDLGLPEPDVRLGVGSGTHAEQVGRVMIAYEQVCLDHPPDFVVVVGDVNATLACTIVAKRLCLPVAHLEAGLRSFDRTMPEEINRVVADALADVLWTPSADADENLRREGIAPDQIERVGNIMIDCYVMLREQIERRHTVKQFGLAPKTYGILTLHRPANVDRKEQLADLLPEIIDLGKTLPLIFPVHPRTRRRLEMFGLWSLVNKAPGIRCTEPLGYVDFMSLVRESRLVITDSGGIQEETTYLDIPCLTLRETTERPVTITQGTNRLVHCGDLRKRVQEVLEGRWPKGVCPEYWDGRTAERVVRSLRKRVLSA